MNPWRGQQRSETQSVGLVWTQPHAGFEEKPQDHLQSQGTWRDQ